MTHIFELRPLKVNIIGKVRFVPPMEWAPTNRESASGVDLMSIISPEAQDRFANFWVALDE